MDVAGSRQARGEQVVVTAHGRLSGADAGPLMADLRSAVHARPMLLVLDMADVSLVDSRCLAMLVRIRKALHHTGGSLTLVNVPPVVLAVLYASGLDKVFEVRPLDQTPVPPDAVVERRRTG